MAFLRYAKNVGRSTAYAIPAIVKNRVPSLHTLVSQFTSAEQRDASKTILGEIRGIVKEDIAGLLSKGLDNAKSELKTGKFYKTEAEENAAMDATFGNFDAGAFDNSFLDEFDAGGEGSSGDNADAVNQARVTAQVAGQAAASGAATGVYAAARALGDSPAARASASAGMATARFTRAGIGTQIAMGNAMRGAIMANGRIMSEIHRFQITQQQQFYRKQIEHNMAMAAMTSEMITRLAEIREVSTVAAAASDQIMQAFSSRTSSFANVFNSNGGLDAKAYLDVMAQRLRTAVGDGSMFKTMGSALASGPLTEAFKVAIESVIPKNFGKQLDQFNDFMSQFGVMLNERMQHASAYLKGKGGALGTLGGKALEFLSIAQDNNPRGPNLSNVVKGKPVAFDGYAHRSLVEIIPSLLSDIHAETVAMRKSMGANDPGDRKLYDFETGRFTSEKQMRKSFEAKAERASMMHFDRVRGVIGDDGNVQSARDVSDALRVMRDNRYSINKSGVEEFAAQYDAEIDRLRAMGRKDEADAMKRGRNRIIQMRKTKGPRAAAELQTAIVRAGSAKSRMYESIETAEGAQRMMYSGAVYNPDTMHTGALDITGRKKGGGKSNSGASSYNNKDDIFYIGEGQDFASVTGNSIFRNESGKVTFRSILQAPMNAVSKAMNAFETKVSDVFFGDGKNGGKRGVFKAISDSLMGDVDPETGKRTGPLGRVTDYVKDNIFNPLRKAAVGDPSDPDSKANSIVGTMRRWFSESVASGNKFLFGSTTVNNMGVTERQGGLFGGVVNYFAGKSKQMKDLLLGKSDGGEDGKKGILIAMREKFDGLVERAKVGLFGSVDENGRRAGGLMGDGIQKGKDFVSNLWSRFQEVAVKPLAQNLFGIKDADGRRSGGLLGGTIQKGKDFMSRLWVQTQSRVLNPLKTAFFGKENEDGSREGGILPMLKKTFRESLVEPLAEGLLGKKNTDGIREGGALKVVWSSMRDAMAPLKETFVGKDGILTNIRKGISDTWSDLKRSMFGGKDGEPTKPLMERIGDKISGTIEKFGNWIQERLKPVTNAIKNAGDWLNEKVFTPFNSWLNDPKTGFITRMREGAASFFYGKKDEDGKREGGLFGTIQKSISKFFYGDDNTPGFVKRVVEPAKKFVLDEIWTPLKSNLVDMWEDTKSFLKNEIWAPMKGVFQPFVTEAKEQWRLLKEWTKGPLLDSFKAVGGIINDSFKNTLGKSLSDMLRENVLNPIKDALSSVKLFFMNTLKAVLKFPVNILKGASDELAISQIRRGIFKGSAEERSRLLNKYRVDPASVPHGQGSSLRAGSPAGTGNGVAGNGGLSGGFAGRNGVSPAQIGTNLATPLDMSQIRGGYVQNQDAVTNAATNSAAARNRLSGGTAGGNANGANPARSSSTGGSISGGAGSGQGGSDTSGTDSKLNLRGMDMEQAAVATADNTRNTYTFMTRHLWGVGKNLERIVKHFKIQRGILGKNADDDKPGLLGRLRQMITNPLSFFSGLIKDTLSSVTRVVNGVLKSATQLILKPISILSQAFVGLTRALAPVAKVITEGLVGTIKFAAKATGAIIKESAKAASTMITSLASAIPGVVKALSTATVGIIKVSGQLLKSVATIAGSIATTLVKMAGTVIATGAKVAKDVVTGLARVTFDAVGSAFNMITGRSKTFKTRVTPVYVVGGFLAGSEGGATSLAEAEALGSSGRLLRRMKGALVGGALGSLTGVGGALGAGAGFMAPGMFGIGQGGFGAVKARTEAASAAKKDRTWRDRLLGASTSTAVATKGLREGFSSFGRWMMGLLPIAVSAITGLVSFFTQGKFITSIGQLLASVLGRGGGVDLPSGGKRGKGSHFGRIAKGAGIAGLIGTGAGMVADNMDDGVAKSAVGTGGAMLQYGALGATIGSVIPGVGTAVGAGVGALAGAVAHNWEGITGLFSNRAYGGPLGQRATMVGELGPEILDQHGNVISGHGSGKFSNPSLVKSASEREGGVIDFLTAIAKNTFYAASLAEAVNQAVGGQTIKTAGEDYKFKPEASGFKRNYDGGLANMFDMALGIDTVTSKVSAVGGAVKEIGGHLWSGAKSMVSSVAGGVTGAGSALMRGDLSGAATSFVSGIRQAGNTAVTTGSNIAGAAGAAYSVIRGNGAENLKTILQVARSSGMTDPKEQAMFLAQLDHESGGFTQLSENLRYRPENLLKVFPKYFRSIDEARQVASGGPEAIANRVYGGRMGNTDQGDGFKYRGRGFIQLTGKHNYAAASKAIGIDLLSNPDAASEPETAAKIAQWYWASRGIGRMAQAGDIEGVTRRINGGLNGLSDRRAKFSKYMNMMPTLTAGGDNATPIKAAMNGGWLSNLPTLVGERQPEVLGPDGRIFKDVSSFIASANADVSGLAVSSAMKEAERRAANGVDTKGANAAFEQIAAAVSNQQGNSNSSLEGVMQQILGVLNSIAANTGVLKNLNANNTTIKATRNSGTNVFIGGNGEQQPRKVGISPEMRAMMA